MCGLKAPMMAMFKGHKDGSKSSPVSSSHGPRHRKLRSYNIPALNEFVFGDGFGVCGNEIFNIIDHRY